MKESQGFISGDLNFLLLPGAPPFPGPTSVTYESLVHWLCGHDVSPAITDILGRCSELPNNGLFIAPHEPRILNKLAYPLRNAKGCYLLGNYLATIALCGYVAEMVATLLLELALPSEPSKNFDRLRQSQRIARLRSLRLLTKEDAQRFNLVSKIRNNYLHVWSEDHDHSRKDAASVFDLAVSLVVFGLGLSVSNSKLTLRPGLVEYLRQRGVFRPSDSDALG